MAVRERVIERLTTGSTSRTFTLLMARGLRHNKRELRAARMCEHGMIGNLAGHALKRADKLWESAWSKSKLYPKMRITDTGSQENHGTGEISLSLTHMGDGLVSNVHN